jgi:hypothetical protein
MDYICGFGGKCDCGSAVGKRRLGNLNRQKVVQLLCKRYQIGVFGWKKLNYWRKRSSEGENYELTPYKLG